MGILVTCPGCGRTLDAPAESVGRTVRCTSCNREFVLQAPAGGAQAGATGAGPAYGDEVYGAGFNLQAVEPSLLNYWKSWRPTSFSVAGAVILDIVTCGLFGLIYYGLKFGELPKASRNDFGAGKGIGFMFIPYFNFYWIFRFWLGLCDRINLQMRMRLPQEEQLPRNIALAICILQLCGIIPYAGILAAIGAMVCREIFVAKMQGVINRLAGEA